MTVEETLKELGYERTIQDDVYTEYMYRERVVGFNAHFKDIKVADGTDCVYIDISTLKAIYKQCEELGWL